MAIIQILSIIGLKLKVPEVYLYFKPFERILSTYTKAKESIMLLLL